MSLLEPLSSQAGIRVKRQSRLEALNRGVSASFNIIRKSHSLEDLDSLERIPGGPIVTLFYTTLVTDRDQQSETTAYEGVPRPADPPTGLIVSHQGWDPTQAVSGCAGGSSRDRTPRWTTLMWRKTISPGPLPCTGSSQLAGLVLYPEPTE